MKRFLAVVLAAGAIGLVGLSPAHAQGGCGPMHIADGMAFATPAVGDRDLGDGDWHGPWGWHRHW